MLDGARRGRGSTLVVRGEPGIGKSWLCEQVVAAAVAAADGMRVVMLRGVPAEANLPYAGLVDALSPLLDLLDGIPAAQAGALRGALGLDAGAVADRLAVGVACLSLLAVAADREPLLIVVDDAQWVDEATLEALRFSARRLEADSVAFLFAARSGERDSLAGAGFAELSLSGLEEQDALALLDEIASGVDEDVARRLIDATGGNPLALREAVRELSVEQRAGRAPLGDPLPTPEAIQDAFGRRLAALPEPTRHAMVVAATDETAPLRVLERALAALGVGLSALELAEAEGLVSVDDEKLRFAHPLIRAAAYHAAAPSLRRRAERALAAEWGQTDSERRAWHMAGAAQGADRETVHALTAAARAASRRGAQEAAARAFRAAAVSAAEPGERARLLLDAARERARTSFGSPVLELLDEATACDPDVGLRSEIELLRGQTLTWHGDLEEAHRVLLAEAERAQDSDPAAAIGLLCEAAFARSIAGDIRAGLTLAKRAHASSVKLEGAVSARAGLALGFALILVGEGRRGYPLFCDSLPETPAALDPVAHGRIAPVPLGLLAVWMDDYELARQDLGDAIVAARDRGTLAELPSMLAYQSELDFRTGDWLAARAHAGEAVQLALETDHEGGYALVTQARLDAALGREAQARENAEAVLASGLSSLAVWATGALGLLELGGGCPERAVEHLSRTATLTAAFGIGEPNIIQWAPDLIEAHIRAAKPEKAHQTLAVFEGQAECTGRPWAKAAAARCRGLLASDGDSDRAFEEALRWHAQTPSPFERARTELSWGKRLRRQGRRVEARAKLHQALERFDALGAEPWSQQALQELRASGQHARRGSRARSEELTAQELQVALLVAEGLTNKEVAHQLFLSPKTIEFHLGRVYRKLKVPNRARLAHVLTRANTSPSPDRSQEARPAALRHK